MCSLTLDAKVENLERVLALVNEPLEKLNCPPKEQIEIDIAVEEVFANIAHYAYGTEVGQAVVQVETERDPPAVSITFVDRGVPYDPRAREDPDVTLPIEKRSAGGLGIFMTKKIMDAIDYEYRDGRNIIRLKKALRFL